ncbi:carbohydrate-binding protein [Nocardia sp. CDC160]|uniref:carbohydrate-binding protein n=1 Tax=Nocardia sp. CDC160 TaxID=3112166 RepID=UPI002DBDD746|nr:carbohydrate-binding protein [Nocardia sp. CDC160]MEC3916598.1 carbohydrate-binding protein [Nocardia sp. CDC160]
MTSTVDTRARKWLAIAVGACAVSALAAGLSGAGAGPAAAASGGGVSPYVDTSLYPSFDLLANSKATGVKQYNLAFVTDGGSCVPKWGGVTEIGQDPTSNQIGDFRKAGGEVRISFGGQTGSELATTCSSESALQSAYEKVITQYQATKLDFDVEGGAIANTAANTLRAQVIAALQRAHPGLAVSFTLPVMPSGLTQDGINLLSNAASKGVDINAVNIMAMDYGSSFNGDMGEYAIQAATATEGQVDQALGLSNSWNKIAVTPMIGVNDVQGETFTLADATKLADFAAAKGLAWTSMWSATRDKPCPNGGSYADPTCSGISQQANAFQQALGGGSGSGGAPTTAPPTTKPTTTTVAPTTTTQPTTVPPTTTTKPTTTAPVVTTTGNSSAQAWKVGATYKVGDVVTYENATYHCLQAHTVEDPTWTPAATPALWEKV